MQHGALSATIVGAMIPRYFVLMLTLVLLIVAAGVASQAQERPKPNFTGTWKFNPQKSALQLPRVPTSSIFRIKHQDPSFELSRTHVWGDKSDAWGITLTTDGTVVIKRDGGSVNRFRGYWLGDSLVFDGVLDSEGDWATNYVVYTLSEDGKVLTAIEHYPSRRQNHDNKWVFEKQ